MSRQKAVSLNTTTRLASSAITLAGAGRRSSTLSSPTVCPASTTATGSVAIAWRKTPSFPSSTRYRLRLGAPRRISVSP